MIKTPEKPEKMAQKNTFSLPALQETGAFGPSVPGSEERRRISAD